MSSLVAEKGLCLEPKLTKKELWKQRGVILGVLEREEGGFDNKLVTVAMAKLCLKLLVGRWDCEDEETARKQEALVLITNLKGPK